MAGRLLLWLICASVIAVAGLRWANPMTSAFMMQSYVASVADGRGEYRIRYRWQDWAMISGQVKLAVIAAEDQRFPDHFGFDFDAMGAAMSDYLKGKSRRGGSTISQQVAKNLFLWAGRNPLRKALEAYFTLLLEMMLPKRRILELYLNIAEFGPGIYGVGAAAEVFFDKPAARLDQTEAALLAAVLPSPRRYRVQHPSAHVRRRQGWILQQMRQLGGPRYLKRIAGG